LQLLRLLLLPFALAASLTKVVVRASVFEEDRYSHNANAG